MSCPRTFRLGTVLGFLAILASPASATPHWRLLRWPARTVRVEARVQISAPSITAPLWDVFLPCPPLLGRQHPRSATTPAGRIVADLTPRRTAIFEVVQRGPNSIQVVLTADIRLYAERLVDISRISPVRNVHGTDPEPAGEWKRQGGASHLVLSRSARALQLSESHLFDFRAPAFTAWMRRERLYRRPHEDDLDLARRIFIFLAHNGHYRYTSRMDRIASHETLTATSDCGGLEILYGSALRANGIPFRALVGRWARSGTATYGQQHVKGEFFVNGIGWIPEDLAAAVQSNQPSRCLHFFGNDRGNFVVLTVDPEVVLPTIHFGAQEIDWLQGFAFWVWGHGTLRDCSKSYTWIVHHAGQRLPPRS